MKRFALSLVMLFTPQFVHASAGADRLDLTGNWVGIASVLLFFVAYLVVMAEEFTHLRKSKPVILAAGVIWGMIAWYYQSHDIPHLVETALRHNLEEYAELMLFLLVAMTFINAMDERNVFEALRSWLVRKGFGYRALFWVTGGLAFLISPIADNLTTALLMAAVVMAVGGENRKFVLLACINIVVAANAGGAFSPFGDITTLMVWQKGKLSFFEFFVLFVPSVVNWVVPAAIMFFAVPRGKPAPHAERARAKPGMIGVAVLFGLTIVTAVSFKNFLLLPPALGMMAGLGYLQMWSFYLQRKGKKHNDEDMILDSFTQVQRVEWDTLLFFFGIIFAVGGLGVLGYLSLASQVLYVGMGDTYANVIIGALSAIVDNIPLMFAVLTMDPAMSDGQWLLITLTTGTGGSLLAIGSAAGVALMGQARGLYTFSSHLRWSWAIALGYGASIGAHMLVNAHLF